MHANTITFSELQYAPHAWYCEQHANLAECGALRFLPLRTPSSLIEVLAAAAFEVVHVPAQ